VSQGQRFRRRALRRGYKVDEVDSFLDRVEATIAALKTWRSTMAKQEGKPAYVYLSDAHITDIAERDPDTTERLARCKGIGPGKLDNYGETILALLEQDA